MLEELEQDLKGHGKYPWVLQRLRRKVRMKDNYGARKNACIIFFSFIMHILHELSEAPQTMKLILETEERTTRNMSFTLALACLSVLYGEWS